MSKLKYIRKKHSGRDSSGSVVVRHQGGEHKRFMRSIDFKRDKLGIFGKVVTIEYDPNRTSEIALIQYTDGEKRYILRPQGLNLGDVIKSGSDAEVKPGNTLQLKVIPIGTFVHNIELTPGMGGQMARTAGSSAQVMAQEGDYFHLKLPSGEIRKIKGKCFATVGTLGNIDWKNKNFGKAGTKRNMGIRPTVRGVAQNPRSHPHGGGEGRSGIGMTTPKTYVGRKAVGETRKKNKYSNKYIIQRRKK
jgi:large subunit ribosomal protein L2